jgi:hypothetical protein
LNPRWRIFPEGRPSPSVLQGESSEKGEGTRKTSGALLILLLVLASLTIVSSRPAEARAPDPEPKTWYVIEGGRGGENGDSWNNAFATIQDAVNAASGGDLIKVGDGTYGEFEVTK